jgi:hypothetical protein
MMLPADTAQICKRKLILILFALPRESRTKIMKIKVKIKRLIPAFLKYSRIFDEPINYYQLLRSRPTHLRL